MSAPARIKFSELVDLLLARLYDLEEERGADQLIDLNTIAQELIPPVPKHWAFDAGRVLEARGLIQAAFAFGGACRALLTGEGRLYVEEQRGTGIIARYHASPQTYVVVTGAGHQVVVGGDRQQVSQSMDIEKQREPAFELLREIEEKLWKDSSLADEQKSDLVNDLEGVRAQLKGREPNRPALAALLAPLSQVASVGGLVAQLVRLLNP